MFSTMYSKKIFQIYLSLINQLFIRHQEVNNMTRDLLPSKVFKEHSKQLMLSRLESVFFILLIDLLKSVLINLKVKRSKSSLMNKEESSFKLIILELTLFLLHVEKYLGLTFGKMVQRKLLKLHISILLTLLH